MNTGITTGIKEKILVLGNYQDAMYHPFQGVDKRLEDMLSGLELVCTDRTAELLKLEEEGYRGVISYLDIWDSTLTGPEAEALEDFVRKGCAALVLHNGISIQGRERLKDMVGARFLTHPPQEPILFREKSHPITEGCGEFELSEEPYQFEMSEDDKEIILLYLYRGQEYPAGWCKSVGQGRLVFLTPGHTAEIFDCPEYRKLIQRSMDWCLKKL